MERRTSAFMEDVAINKWIIMERGILMACRQFLWSCIHWFIAIKTLYRGQVLCKNILITTEANALCHVLTGNDNLINEADDTCQSQP